jgi:hypothetical protein
MHGLTWSFNLTSQFIYEFCISISPFLSGEYFYTYYDSSPFHTPKINRLKPCPVTVKRQTSLF